MKGWATNVTAQEINISTLGSNLVSGGIQLPIETNRSEIDRIDLQIESQTEFYSVDATAFVYAGDCYRPHWITVLGMSMSLQANLKISNIFLKNNELLRPFSLLIVVSRNWHQVGVSLHIQVPPPYLSVGEEISSEYHGHTTTTDPSLHPSSKLVEGNTLRLWTAVAPEVGGEPNIQHTFLHVQATIMVELMAENTESSCQQLMYSTIEFWTNPVELEMQVRHNLITNPDTTVNVNWISRHLHSKQQEAGTARMRQTDGVPKLLLRICFESRATQMIVANEIPRPWQ